MGGREGLIWKKRPVPSILIVLSLKLLCPISLYLSNVLFSDVPIESNRGQTPEWVSISYIFPLFSAYFPLFQEESLATFAILSIVRSIEFSSSDWMEQEKRRFYTNSRLVSFWFDAHDFTGGRNRDNDPDDRIQRGTRAVQEFEVSSTFLKKFSHFSFELLHAFAILLNAVHQTET